MCKDTTYKNTNLFKIFKTKGYCLKCQVYVRDNEIEEVVERQLMKGL